MAAGAGEDEAALLDKLGIQENEDEQEDDAFISIGIDFGTT